MLEDIMKSSADNKQYRYVVFDNQLTCLLIHDPEMNKSSADGAPQDQVCPRGRRIRARSYAAACGGPASPIPVRAHPAGHQATRG